MIFDGLTPRREFFLSAERKLSFYTKFQGSSTNSEGSILVSVLNTGPLIIYFTTNDIRMFDHTNLNETSNVCGFIERELNTKRRKMGEIKKMLHFLDLT